MEFVVDVSEAILYDEVLHPHASVGRSVPSHHVGDIGHTLHTACHHHILAQSELVGETKVKATRFVSQQKPEHVLGDYSYVT